MNPGEGNLLAIVEAATYCHSEEKKTEPGKMSKGLGAYTRRTISLVPRLLFFFLCGGGKKK